MVLLGKLLPLFFFAPVLLSAAFYTIPTQNTLSQNLSNTSSQTKNRNFVNTGLSENNKVQYLIDIHSGYKTIYTRKATFGPIGFGEENVPVNGFILNIPSNKSSLKDVIIKIQAIQNDKTIYEKFVRTDGNGSFISSFVPPEDGTVQLKATLAGENSTASEGIITVIVVESEAPIIIIAVLIGLAIALIVIHSYQHTGKKIRSGKIKILNILYPIGVASFTIAAFIMLYRFPPFDAAGNAAFAAAMIAPIAVYVFQILSTPSNTTQSANPNGSKNA